MKSTCVVLAQARGAHPGMIMVTCQRIAREARESNVLVSSIWRSRVALHRQRIAAPIAIESAAVVKEARNRAHRRNHMSPSSQSRRQRLAS